MVPAFSAAWAKPSAGAAPSRVASSPAAASGTAEASTTIWSMLTRPITGAGFP